MRSKEPVIPIAQITPSPAASAKFRYRLWLSISAIFGFAVFIWLLALCVACIVSIVGIGESLSREANDGMESSILDNILPKSDLS